jgi:hypothetical protein
MVWAFIAAACAGSPPNDALQAAQAAIDGARDAEDCAPEEFRAAERLLEQANAANDAGDFDRARILAESAQQQAERARLTAGQRRRLPPQGWTTMATIPSRPLISRHHGRSPAGAVYLGFDARI